VKRVIAARPRKVRTPWARMLGNTQGERSPVRAIEKQTACGQGWKGEVRAHQLSGDRQAWQPPSGASPSRKGLRTPTESLSGRMLEGYGNITPR